LSELPTDSRDPDKTFQAGVLITQANSMPHTQNKLIELLPKKVQQRFIEHCEPFELVFSAELERCGTQLSHAYFPRAGAISMVLDIDGHPPVEVGMIGRESMVGSEVVIGAGLTQTPWRAVVAGAGNCLRIEISTLEQDLVQMPELQSWLKRDLMIRLHQLSLASTCQCFHSVGQRLARWLLMSLDRAQANQIFVTQEFISTMLGVRRSSVTVYAIEFQMNGLIEYNRGELKLIDRIGLERAACSCYEADKWLQIEAMKS